MGNGVPAVIQPYHTVFLDLQDFGNRRQLIGHRWHGAKCRALFLHQVPPRKAVRARRQGVAIESIELFEHGCVELVDVEELLRVQIRQDLDLHPTDRILYSRFVLGLAGADCNRDCAVVVAELSILVANLGVVLVGLEDQTINGDGK